MVFPRPLRRFVLNGPLANLLMAFSAVLSIAGTAQAGDGQWSRHAAAVPANRAFSVPSPDRTMAVQVAEREANVLRGRYPVEGGEKIGILLPAEIGWSPDSKAFFITSSDGGPEGTWDAALFLLQHERFVYYTITAEAADRFANERPCASSAAPHAGVVKFVQGSQQVLLAVEAPVGSSCGAQDRFRGYIVEAPSGTIIRELDQKRLLADWGESLGVRFDGLVPRPER